MHDPAVLESHMLHCKSCEKPDCFRCLYIRNMEAWHRKLPWLQSSLADGKWGLWCKVCREHGRGDFASRGFVGPGNYSNVSRHARLEGHKTAEQDLPPEG